ncbi:nuclease-related domain-containing protein [Lysinibacillus sp. NPDC097287]|uniref:nuclease-related domain-containing protein n=1 Tax=Lysinibacillus sp. NPDC097287 TaxID=3364144 RepID=UPI0037FCA871
MIILPRKISDTQRVLEAIERRLPPTHEDFSYYSEQLRRVKAGFAGEQRVDREWIEIDLPQPHYFLHDLQVTNRFGNTHQIDTILLCPYIFLVLEIKNITGFIEIDEQFHQFNRTTAEGRVEGMSNPFHQIERHVELLSRRMKEEGIVVPIKYAVVSATKNAILSPSLHGRSIFHVTGLRLEVKKLLSQYRNPSVDPSNLEQFMKTLLAMHVPKKREIKLPVKDLITGVLCPDCKYKQQMYYSNNKWFCLCCGNRNLASMYSAMIDYRLLVSETITNKDFCAFFGVGSTNVAYKLLKHMKLVESGAKKNRTYRIPEFVGEIYESDG